VVRDLLRDEARGAFGLFVVPRGEEELAEEGVEGLLDGDAGGAGDVELGAQGEEEPVEDAQGAEGGGGLEGGGGEGAGALGVGVADFDDGGGREEGGGAGYVGEVALDGGEEL
jgi:hypothetical protein